LVACVVIKLLLKQILIIVTTTPPAFVLLLDWSIANLLIVYLCNLKPFTPCLTLHSYYQGYLLLYDD
jgi:hypothetical protein